MQKMNYPLIISDFDGTLLKSDSTIDDQTKMQIERYRMAGGRFAICTGRTASSILPRVRELGLTGLVACFQGSVILDIESEDIIVDGCLPQTSAAEICQFLETLGLRINVYALDNYYSNQDSDLLKVYEQVCGVRSVIVKDMPLSRLIVEQNIKVRKVLVLVTPEEKQSVYETLSARLGEEYYVTYSAAFLVEVTSKQYSKATAVRFLADYYNVPLERTVAVGDSLNDLPMIEAAGVGIAVKNADEALKKAARVVCAFTNNENAIGEIIEEYGYTKE